MEDMRKFILILMFNGWISKLKDGKVDEVISDMQKVVKGAEDDKTD